MSTTVRDTLAVCLADLPVCRTIHLRLADITSLWVRTPLSVARPDETPGHNQPPVELEHNVRCRFSVTGKAKFQDWRT